ncbi:HAD family hydrolase [Pseudoalteromonas luteoviolacea]|uniref:HAD family hydrolase n=1 Tax=Pseudoalteromonas luteoviolacea TaxID=43657 RepID=UPI001B37E2A4|nr:HAD family hydrolase [Pseudoalteromonas luteoviolacea]MBQ4838271.1 HAD family hydrolase [Pseudoalteromonas luteoviolacea]
MKKLVIFDLDDTIYAEQQYNLACYRAAADKFHEDFKVDIYPYIFQEFSQGNYRDLFSLAIQEVGVECSEDYIRNELVSTYRSYQPELTPYDGFERHISNLRDKYALAIITDGPLDIQKAKIKALGISKYFDVILCSSELGSDVRKPSAQPYEYVLNKLGMSHKDSVYIGDNKKKDFVYPNSSGMHSIHILNKVENDNLIYGRQEGESAQHYCESYEELVVLLESIFE